VRVSEAHHPTCHADPQEPPTQDPLPPPDGGALCLGSTVAWGNSLGRKTQPMVRVCFQNLDGLSQLPEGDGLLKLHTLLQFTNTFQINMFAAAKLNMCWDLLPPDLRLPI